MLPPHHPYDCAIELIPCATLSRLYNLSRPEQQAMEEYIPDSLAPGIICPSSSPVGTGFFFVGMKDGSLHPCIDFQGLNEITVKNTYPLSLINPAINPLYEAIIVTKIDLQNSYHQIWICDGDEWKTAFNTPLGHFEYLVMPSGLTNAPTVFQNLVNDILQDMINRFVFIYLDDILIYSKNPQEHHQHVRQVLERVLQNHQFMKAEKCEFHANTISFLDYIISLGRITMDPIKITAVKEWPQPESL